MTTSHHIQSHLGADERVVSGMRRRFEDVAVAAGMMAVVVALALAVSWLVPFELIAPRPR
jgi:hypothetical protein